ncbi:MAG TPA: threonine--tRNA ligase [Firmicutes bacterium]|nr:threonine--tRNA ligase [Bacillota bacterium]
MIKLTKPDGSVQTLTGGLSGKEVVAGLDGALKKEVICLKVDGELVDLSAQLPEEAGVSLVLRSDPEALVILRHSASHIMAQAVKKIFPTAKLAIGPAIENGFYYDFDLPRPLTPEDLTEIEAEMRKIVKEDYPFTCRLVGKEEALAGLSAAGEKYKVELVSELNDGEISFYQQGEFSDLCRGPHLPSTRYLKAFKLTSIAGAYWRGDSSREMLQRIYGTAFFSKEELENYFKFMEEAAKRDHRKLGRELDLFSADEQIGAGLILWHPKGGRIRQAIEDFWREEHRKNGYELVYTPHLGRRSLWETSGHLGFYQENMYSGMEVEGQEYLIKPMNCPFHIAIYQSRSRSYRELPFRWAELGTVYRYERSGVLHGLLRVRGFTQDDAHIFCRPDQMPDEIDRVLDFCLQILKAFGFKEFELYLATKPEKSVGAEERWAAATEALRAAIEKTGLPYKVDEGGGAFYGPKIDLKIKDALGREWQCSTIQFDFNEPERFALSYKGTDSQDHQPYMIHRALLGSLERFFGILIENYEGAFPLWLAPVQTLVLPVLPDNLEYAGDVYDWLRASGIRAELDSRNEKIGYRIREAQMQKVPYMLVVGSKEAESGLVAVRTRKEGDLGAWSREQLLARMQEEIAQKS